MQSLVMTQFIFSPESIEDNRLGRMTSTQMSLLRRSLGRYQGTLIFLVLLLLIPAMLFIFTPAHDWIVTCLVSLLFFSGLAVLIGFQWALLKDASDGQVSKITGKIRIVTTGGKGTTHFELHLQDKAGLNHLVKVGRQDAKLFKTGVCYDIFYAPRSQILLSAEETGC